MSGASFPSRPPGAAPRAILAKCVPGLILSVLLSFGISLTMFVPPLYMMKLFTSVSASGSAATIVGLSSLAVGAIVLFSILDYLRSCTYQRLSAWLAEQLGALAPAPMTDRALAGQESPAEIPKDIAALRDLVASGGLTAALDLVWAPMFFFALFLLHPFFGWLALAAAALLIGIAIVNEIAARGPAREEREAVRTAYRELGEALNAAETVEAMGLLGPVAARWERMNLRIIAAGMRGASRHALASSGAKGLRMTLQLAVFGGGMMLVLEQEAHIGTLLAASLILTRALAPLEQLIDRWRQWSLGAAALRRGLSALSAPPRIDRSQMPLPRPARTLELQRIVYIPEGCATPILNQLSYTAEAGSVTGLAGAAAAGKSTVLQLIAGIWQPSSGNVTLDGHHTSSWPRADFRRHAGYLPQSVQLFGPSIRLAIAGLEAGDPERVIEAAELAGIHEAIGRLPQGYDTPLELCGRLLSGGQRQQVALARAYYEDPALLLLDEPDASLDRAAMHRLTQTMRHFAERGAIVLFTSHRPEILRTADRALLLDRGALIHIAEMNAPPFQRKAGLRPAEAVHGPDQEHVAGAVDAAAAGAS